MLVRCLSLLLTALVCSAEPDLDLRLVDELNEMRTDPPRYARKIEARLRHSSGRRLRLPGQTTILTREGVSAAEEAIRVLRNTPALPLLADSAEIAKGARDHALDIGRTGKVSHEGSDSSEPEDRMRRYLPNPGATAEVISFGPSNAQNVIVELLIDDGVRNRGHRKILLDPLYRTAGAACAPHKTFRVVCVIDLTDRVAGQRKTRRSRQG